MHRLSIYFFKFKVSAVEWCSNRHSSITPQPLTALEQWKAFRHRSLWVAMDFCTVSKWTAPSAVF